MSTPKERHYWAQLRAALTSGQWRSPHPARTPNSTPIPWTELLRKFNKHCRGYTDVAEVAAQTQALTLLLSARYADDDEDILIQELSPSAVGTSELGLEGVGILDEERIGEAMAGYQALKNIETSKFDTIHLALAYYAFALRKPSECLSYLQKVPNLLQYQNHIPSSPDSSRNLGSLSANNYAPSTTSLTVSLSSNSAIDPTTPEIRDGRVWAMTETFRSLCLQGMSIELMHPSDIQAAINAYCQALPLLSIIQTELCMNPSGSTPYRPTAKPDISFFSQMRELWRWVERLVWRAVILSAKTCDVFADAPVPAESSPASAATMPNANNNLWTWLGHYSACSIFWPPTFRPKHRSTVYVIHLRAFVLRFGGSLPISVSSTPLSSSSSSRTSASSASTTQLGAWRNQALAVVKAYCGVLKATTDFPRAGERNIEVEEFVELCVALWEAGWIISHVKGKQNKDQWESIGEDLGASWVIDILHWSQTLTFNSSQILRHLTQLLYLSSTSPLSPAPQNRMLAKRTLQLYIQVVGKAWEASKEGVGEDMDSDGRWVETLVFGARMLANDVARHFQEGGGVDSPRYSTSFPSPTPANSSTHSSFSYHFAGHSPLGAAQQGQQAPSPPALHAPLEDDGMQVAEVHEAASVLEKARLRLNIKDARLLGEVFLAEGVVWGLLGAICQDPLNRPSYFHKAHGALLRSVETNPTPSAYYHLALSFARRTPASASAKPAVKSTSIAVTDEKPVDPYQHTHSLTRALECAGIAVEGCPKDVRYWHLLGLLLTAQENWAGAREVLDRGSELDFDSTEGGEVTPEGINSSNDDDDEESESESDESEVAAETGEAFVVLGANGMSSKPESVNGKDARPKRKRSMSTITPNGRAASAAHSSTPAITTVLDQNATSLPPASTLLTYLRPIPSNVQRNEAYGLTFDQYPPTSSVLFERHLQLRMTQVALTEIIDGPEGAEEGWLEVFAWVAERHREIKPSPDAVVEESKEGVVATGDAARLGAQEKSPKMRMYHGLSASTANVSSPANSNTTDNGQWGSRNQMLEVPIGITISPATPEIDAEDRPRFGEQQARILISEPYEEEDGDRSRGRQSEDEKRHNKKKSKALSTHEQEKADEGLQPKLKRSLSSDRSGGGDTSTSKKVQQMLKNRVDKSRAGISAVSRKIGHGVVKNGALRRANSTPDFHAVLQPTSYQASSIHSRRRLSSIIHSSDEREPGQTRSGTPVQGDWPSTPSPASMAHRDFTNSSQTSTTAANGATQARNARGDRLMSDLWLMSAATFRRLGKIDQAKGSIQEAETRDETNPNVWVQLGLYYVSIKFYQHAVDTFQKARFISPDDVAANVHLARLYLDPDVTSKLHHACINQSAPSTRPMPSSTASSPSIPQQPASPIVHAGAPPTTSSPKTVSDTTCNPNSDLAAGMLTLLTRGHGWDVPEAWYFLSKAYAVQGRKEKEREALQTALELSESRGVRDVGRALGWCI